MSHLLFHHSSFFTTLVATWRCRCLLRSARVNVMPERLLSVISGILAGGIPGFRFELCCFSPSYLARFCVFVCFLCFASFSVVIFKMTHKMSSCMLFPLLVAIPLLCVLFGLFWLWLCVFLFVCVLLFWFGLFLMGLLTGLCIGPLPALLRLSTN